MATTKFRLKAGNFEVEVEGEQEYVDKKFTEISEKLFTHPEQINKLIQSQPQESKVSVDSTTPLTKTDLEGIMEYGSDGKPRLSIANPTSRLSISEAMTLFMYAYEPQNMTLNELKKIICDNWKAVDIRALSAVMATTLKGRVVKEGIRGKYIYHLSGSGKDFVRNTISKLKRVDLQLTRGNDSQ